MKEKKDVGFMILIIIFIMSFLFFSYTIVLLGYSKMVNKLEYKTAGSISFTLHQDDAPKEDRQYYKSQITKLAGNPFYFYQEKEMKGLDGKTYLAFRIVVMNKSIDINDYIFSFTHELMHLKYNTACERFINLQAFKTLYESNDPTLRYCALWYAHRDMNGWITKEYSCWGYIKDYLENGEPIWKK